MEINISQEVKNHLRGRGSKTITIYTETMMSCWSSAQDVFVNLKEPAVPQEFNKYQSDDISVYLFKEAVVKEDSISIEIAKSASDFANKDFDVIGLDV